MINFFSNNKNYILIVSIVCLAASLNAQNLPLDFKLSTNVLNKTADKTPLGNTVEKIEFVADTIWIATSKGLSKSTDNGNSWTNFYKTEAFGEEGISAIGYQNGVVWTSTWHLEELFGSSIGVGSGLRYSASGGKSWIKIEQPVDNKSDTIIVYGNNNLKANPTTVPQENFIYDLAFTTNTIWYAAKAGGLRKSTDMGKTWKKIVLPPDNLNSIKPTDQLNFKYDPSIHLNHRVFSILVIDDNTLYVGTANGINKTTDGGISWVKFNHTNQSKPISGNFVLSLEQNKFDNSIWAATWKAEGATEYWAVSSSTNSGNTWETYLSDSRTLDFGFKYIQQNNQIISADIFAATQDGMFRSSNNGITWISAPTIVDQATNISLGTRHFRTVEVKKKNDNTYDIWLGSNRGLARLNESTGFWTGIWKVFLASPELKSITEVFAFPNPFSPLKEKTNIKYGTTQSTNVTIRLFDFGMNLIKTLIQNAPRGESTEQIETWDGKDEFGKVVPNGVYFYRLDFGNGEPLFGKLIVLM